MHCVRRVLLYITRAFCRTIVGLRRIDFAIIGNQSRIDFFSSRLSVCALAAVVLSLCAHRPVVFNGEFFFFLFLRISLSNFCHCAIVHLLIFTGFIDFRGKYIRIRFANCICYFFDQYAFFISVNIHTYINTYITRCM